MKRSILSKVLSLMLVMGMLLMVIPVMSISAAEPKTGDDGITNWDFIEPVTHKKTVPSGYTGISTAEQLNNIRNNLTGSYILMNDIDLASMENWVPIGIIGIDGIDTKLTFTGKFDGNGYSIKNMKIDITEDKDIYAGLFGYTKSSEIKNIAMLNSNIKAEFSLSEFLETVYAGGITGYADNTVITNCYNTGKITSSSEESVGLYAGGTAGYATSTVITNCYNTGKITSSSEESSYYVSAGGIVGGTYKEGYDAEDDDFAIINCYNTGEVNSKGYAGGIAGDISKLRDYGEDFAPAITNCYNTGTVIAGLYAGGIVGSISNSQYTSYTDTITNCYNTGTVTAGSCAGGIAGSSDAEITKCCNAGTVTADSCAGGIVGTGTPIIANCYNTGNVTVTAESIPENFPSVISAGGIMGYLQAPNSSFTITNCYNTGNISFTEQPSDSYGGGILGGRNMVEGGGSGTITNCYHLNNISAAIGTDEVEHITITNIKSLTSDQMKQRTSFVGFNFYTIWDINANTNNGYPYFGNSDTSPAIMRINNSNAVCKGGLLPINAEGSTPVNWK